MKSLIKYLSAVAIAAGLTATVNATPINGSIGFGGTFSTDNDADFTSATTFASFTATVTAGSQAGDYAGVPGGTSASFTAFSFGAASIIPLWTFTDAGAGITYDFSATSVVKVTHTKTLLAFEGSGIALITGLDPTPGVWNITANSAGSALTFSSSAAVPDGGATALLLGLGLLGVGLAARRFKKA